MNISENIPIDVNEVLSEIVERQTAPWNNGRINEYKQFPTLQKLFKIINSGIPKEDFFFSGDLFRLHSSYVMMIDNINTKREKIISKICSDGSCSVLPYSQYSKKLVAFSKSHKFTHEKYPKVYPDDRSILIHVNTNNLYGIDVNAFLYRYDIETRYEKEQEVLFPLLKRFIIKEYCGTPNKFSYYLRRYNN